MDAIEDIDGGLDILLFDGRLAFTRAWRTPIIFATVFLILATATTVFVFLVDPVVVFIDLVLVVVSVSGFGFGFGFPTWVIVVP